MSGFARLAGFHGIVIVAALSVSAAQAQVVPDGGTATTVTIDGSGRPVVGIAPAGAGDISRNTFTDFSVGAVGVDLDNRLIGARTILSEVTSANRSVIGGPLEVLGPRAHFILANPNGITVDGGRFINTGGVTLNAGPARLEVSGGQTDVVTTTDPDADILIGPEGLSGAMSSLQLAAGRLRIDGPVLNENTSPFADIALVAGNAELTHDSSVVPGTTTSPFATRTDLPGSDGSVLVDVTPRGSLTASRVSVAVSAEGAGVSFAGTGLASIGEFSIDGQGQVRVDGGTVRAERDLAIRAHEITVLNAPEREARVESLSGAVTLRADLGNIDITGRVTGVSRSGTDPDSLGAVTLRASDSINLLGESADRLTIVFASDGDLVARASAAIRNDNARLLANAMVDLEAGTRIDNITRFSQPRPPRVEIVHSPRGLFSFLFGRPRTTRTTYHYGRAAVAGEIASIAGERIVIDTPHLFNSGNIFALDGPAVINATRVHNQGTAVGQFSTIKRCRIVCWSRGYSTANILGGQISAAAGLAITAGESIGNDAGAFLALGNMELDAPFISTRARFLPTVINPPGGLRNLFAGRRAFVAQEAFGGTITSSGGSILLTSTQPVRVISGEIEGSVGVTATAGFARSGDRLPVGGVMAQRIGLFADWLP
ncbi:MAG: filamentous hemagglutinin N-terminal domain-containing protein [Salinarimonas sp.]|nr:filamentous hemagglutinin N-terminal domain-containing protein [Salinarimonas sp.]